MKCLVIEDELPAQKLITKYIEQTSDLVCVGVFGSVAETPIHYFGEVDMIFLDIQLPNVNGIEFLKSVNITTKVIITTAYRDYAIEAFEEAVVDYLLKPYSYQRFLKAIMRAQEGMIKMGKEEGNQLFIYANKSFYKIDKNDILYIKAEVDYICVFYADKKLLVQESMNKWELKLKGSNFIRVHRSYIVNLDKVDRVESSGIVYIDENRIPIGKTYKKTFLERFRNNH